jgi:hypothetical protein
VRRRGQTPIVNPRPRALCGAARGQ